MQALISIINMRSWGNNNMQIINMHHASFRCRNKPIWINIIYVDCKQFLLSPEVITLCLFVFTVNGWRHGVLAVHPGPRAPLQLLHPLLADAPLHLPPLVLYPGQLLLHLVRHVRYGGGDEELEHQHDVLQHDDQEDGLGGGDVGKHSMNRTGETNESTVDDDTDHSHDLHGSLPASNVLDSLREGSLVDETQFESITANLNQIVEESTETSKRISRTEQCDVTKLYEHLQVIIKGSIILRSWTLHLHLTNLSWSCWLPVTFTLLMISIIEWVTTSGGFTGRRTQCSK